MLRALNLGDCCAMVRRAAYIRAVLDRVEHAALIGVMLKTHYLERTNELHEFSHLGIKMQPT